jgi:hypothetical protein
MSERISNLYTTTKIESVFISVFFRCGTAATAFVQWQARTKKYVYGSRKKRQTTCIFVQKITKELIATM